ncbi:MAG TPA: zinc-binding dehydrogenase [Chloroflexia bacterium]|nr:zinc-binding dehydrogenase [Chloroflexia bacterium]
MINGLPVNETRELILKVAERLFSSRGFSYVAFDENKIAHVPANLTLAEAAAVPLAALTALQALRNKAQVQAGERVLVYSASGGVGSFAVQNAKASGAHVTAVCSASNIGLVRNLGADEVIDYTRDDFRHKKGEYGMIFDVIGSYSLGQVRQALRPEGILVSVNPVRGNPLARFVYKSVERD